MLARSRAWRGVVAGACLLVAAGCAAPAPSEPSAVPLPQLGRAPDQLPPSYPLATLPPTPAPDGTQGDGGRPAPESVEGAVPDDRATADGDPAGPVEPTPAPGQPRGQSGGPAPAAPRQPRTLVTIDDPARDHGLEGPAHADLRRIVLVDEGAVLRITVTLAGPVPATLAEGEVLGLGIDLLEGADGESAYQVFVDGGSDGWRAYLQTPEGFVAYPGSFGIGGDRIELRVPWEALGDPAGGPVDAFLDWSRARPLLNAASRDRAPDRGSARFRRG